MSADIAGTARQRILTTPGDVIVDVVMRVEPGLDRRAVTLVAEQVADTRTKQRRLAHALHEDPTLLTSGRPAGPRLIAQLITELQQLGPTKLTLPCCARCRKPRPLRERDGAGQRICCPCARTRRTAQEPCASCGEHRRIAGQDRHGRPLCHRCHQPQPTGDFLAVIHRHLVALDTGLSDEDLRRVVVATLPQPHRQRQVGWELEDHTERLGANAALGSHQLVRLAEALSSRGARHIPAPACTRCGSTKRIHYGINGARCCRTCYELSRQQTCSRCHKLKTISARTLEGLALCEVCSKQSADFHERCDGCDQVAVVAIRTERGALCRRCYRGPVATCSICGRTKPCADTRIGKPRCENCTRNLKAAECAQCHRLKPVRTRDDAGRPFCYPCMRKPKTCCSCKRTMMITGASPAGPLCKTCYRKDPVSFRACADCGTVEHLYHYGLCTACAAARQLRLLLADDDGHLTPTAEQIFEALVVSQPLRLVIWINASSTARVLRELVASSQPLTHALLDQRLPSKAVQFLRVMLIAGKVLPPRDEHLAALERWIPTFIRDRIHPDEQQTVLSYATWHHLRRLRGSDTDTTQGQAIGVRDDLTTVASLLSWLRERERSLLTSSQADIDSYLAAHKPFVRRVRYFLDWTRSRRLSADICIPSTPPSRPRHSISQDQRWALARRLLHDDTLPAGDRFAGLLLLLFGQPLTRIHRMTTAQVHQTDQGVQVSLGSKPLDLPAPMGEMALHLVATRHGRARLGVAEDHPWLFPGGRPGTAMSVAHLKRRLAAIGLTHPRAARNAAMTDLALHLPAAVVSQLLGLSDNTATDWALWANSSNASYGAHVAHR